MNSSTFNSNYSVFKNSFFVPLKKNATNAFKATERTQIFEEKKIFQDIYETHFEVIFKYMTVVFGNKKIAKEHTHNIFLNAWYLYNGYLSENQPSLIDILQIARHLSLNENLKVQSKKDDTKYTSYQFQSVNLRQDFQDLSPQQRSVIYLVLVEGLSYEDVARVEHSNVEQVQNIYRNAITVLRV